MTTIHTAKGAAARDLFGPFAVLKPLTQPRTELD